MGLEFFVSLIVGLAVSKVAHVFGSLFAKKPPPTPSPQILAPDPLEDTKAVGGPLPGIFGHRRIAGRSLFQGKINNKTYIVYVIAGAPVTGVDGVYVNNDLVTIDGSNNVQSEPWASGGTSSMKIKIYDGTQTVTDTDLDTAFPGWNADFVGKQICYAVVTLNPSISSLFTSTYSAGIPDFLFHVRGFKCYDPRDGGCVLGNTSTYIFSTNPSIIEANYLIHVLGMNLPTSSVDWTSVDASADVDDESVSLKAGGTERRYTACLYWMTDEAHEAVLDRIGKAHAGGARPVGQKFVMMAGSFPGSSTAVVPDDYAGDGLVVTERTPISGRVNGVRGQFTSPANNYEMRDFPTYQDATALSEDNGREEWLDLTLDCVTSHSQAQRLARIAYKRARYGYKASVTTKFKHFDIVSNDIMSITDEMAGLSSATFRVESEQLDEGYELNFDLSYEDSTFFAWTAASDEADYDAGEPVLGETGQITAPGFALVDVNAAAGQIHIGLKIWPSYSSIPEADHYRYDARGGVIASIALNTVTTAAISPNTMFVSGDDMGTGAAPFKLTIERADNSDIISAEVSLPSPTLASTLEGATASSTNRYILPAGPTPVTLWTNSGVTNLFVKDVTAVEKAQDIVLYENTTNDSSGATIHSSQAVSASGNTFAPTGTPGTVKFFWSAIRNNSTPQTGPKSKPVLVVF